MKKFVTFAVFAATIAAASPASAAISVLIGDKDGYGYGRSDSSTGIAWPGPGPSGSSYDGRSAAEAAATNGAQFTDNYSAFDTTYGPNAATSGDFTFAFSGSLTAGAKISIAMGDFQTSSFGAFSASINGTPVAFSFDDGYQTSVIRDFVLTAPEITAANTLGAVVLHLDRGTSVDFVAFDYLQLSSVTNGVPEPSTWAMMLLGLAGLGFVGRRKAATMIKAV